MAPDGGTINPIRIHKLLPHTIMETNTPTTCPDCSGELREIKMIDGTHLGDKRMRFTLKDEKRSLWDAQYSKTWNVDSFTCVGCGRIFLYRSTR